VLVGLIVMMWQYLQILTQLVHQHPLHQQELIEDNKLWVVEVDGQLVVLHKCPLSFETVHLFYQGQKGTKAHMVHHWPFSFVWWMVRCFCKVC